MGELRAIAASFAEAVPHAFAKHLQPLGFALKQSNEVTFVAESPHCRLTVVLDRVFVAVSVKPFSQNPEEGYEEYDLLMALRSLYQGEDFSEELLLSASDVPIQLDRLLSLFTRYFGDGEFSDWARMQARTKERERSPAGETLLETHQERIARIRAMARPAYCKQDYISVISIYSILSEEGVTLTDSEREMYNEALRWDASL